MLVQASTLSVQVAGASGFQHGLAIYARRSSQSLVLALSIGKLCLDTGATSAPTFLCIQGRSLFSIHLSFIIVI